MYGGLDGGRVGELNGKGVHVGKMHPLSIFLLSKMVEMTAFISCTEPHIDMVRGG